MLSHFSDSGQSSAPAADAGSSRHGNILAVVALLLGWLAVMSALPGVVSACSTPVYRYAMYNWQTAPYFVFYFHEGEIAEEDQAVNQAIGGLSENFPPEANLRIEPVDVTDEKQMERLPEFVIEAWKSHEDGALPAHVIFSPWRAHIHSGRLDAAAVERLIDSPARQQFGRLLEEGNAAVMILVTSADEEADQKAEEALAELQKMAAAGQVPLEMELPPGLTGQMPEANAEAGNGQSAADPNKLSIAVLKVDRNDPAEEFFVRTLMAIEEDLQDYADQPMIFAGYGRGRAMEPYIGKGITPDNLLDVVAFLAGPCSCMVKEQNPGADLLVKWNWEATADKMAENDPSLDYGPSGYGEPAGPVEVASSDEAPESVEAAGEGAAPGETAAAETASAETAGEVAEDDASGGAVSVGDETLAGISDASEPGPSEIDLAAHDPALPVDGESYVRSRLWTYGLGLGAIAAGVLVAGLALVLRRS